MNENEVKKAFDEIEPKSGAQERIYANILKKAAAQGGEKCAEGAQTASQPARRPIRAARAGGIAL